MVYKLFAALQAKDQKAFVALYPNARQFGGFMHTVLEKSLKTEEVRKLMEADPKSKDLNVDSLIDAQTRLFSSPEMFSQMEKAFGEVFQKTITTGEEKGVRWSEAKLTGYSIDSSSAFKEEGIPVPIEGIKEAKGVIDFSVGEEAYELAFDKIMFIESEGGWFGAELPQLTRKGESPEPSREDNVKKEKAATQKKTPPAANKKSPAAKTGTNKAPVRKKS